VLCTRRSSRPVRSQSWRATLLSRSASPITALRLMTNTLASLMASAERRAPRPSQAEHVAEQVERPDLPAAVAQAL
jgi:hypothetical protein